MSTPTILPRTLTVSHSRFPTTRSQRSVSVVSGDIVAAMDQATQAARETARPVAAFYAGLKDAGVDEHTRSQLTLVYARRIFLGGKSGP